MFKSSTAYAIAAMLFAATSGAAQTQTVPDHKPGWQLIVNSGTMVPTGAHRDAIKRGKVTSAQVAYVVRPSVAVTASFGWGRTRDIATVGDPRVDMFTYDVGGEVRADRWLAGTTLDFSPFAGIGAGGRSYNYRNLDVDATHNLAAYASAGGEIGVGSRVKLRLEARDYVTGFKPLTGTGAADTRNDLSVMAGLRLKVR